MNGLDESELRLAVLAGEGTAEREPGHAVFENLVDLEEVLGDFVEGFDDDDGPLWRRLGSTGISSPHEQDDEQRRGRRETRSAPRFFPFALLDKWPPKFDDEGVDGRDETDRR